MTPQEKEIRLKLKSDFLHYAKKCLKIRTKKGAVIPFEVNKAQQYVFDKLEEQKALTRKVRALILKGRQQGMSTLVAGRFYHISTHQFGTQVFILTHALDATSNLYKMVQRYHEHCPRIVRPEATTSNSKELIFGALDSAYKIGTAENKSVGRSSTIQLFHGCLSEDSLIVLADGSTKSMHDIAIGDLVFTSSGAIAPVKEKIYTGEKQTFTLDCWLSGEPIYLTDDHKVLTIDGYKELKDINTHDFIAMPKIEISHEINNYKFSLKNKERQQGGGSKHIEEYDFPLNYDFGYLLGYYLAEGHVKDGCGYLSFTYHKDETYIDQAIKGTFELATSIKHKVDEGTNRKRTIINGKFLTSAINQICGRVSNKNIPLWFFKTNKDFLSGVFHAYLDGDGSKTQQDKIAAPSVHEKIARQIQRICWALYGGCSVRRKTRSRYGKETKDIFLFSLSGNPMRKFLNQDSHKRIEKSIIKDGIVYSRVKSISPRKIEKVWDIEIDHPDHNYQTTSGIVSNSEVAFWANASEHAKGILQAVPNEAGTEVILESTANGIGNYFHEQWQAAESGESDFIAIFVPWFWQDEYRREIPDDFTLSSEESELVLNYDLDYQQIYWRRLKIAELSVGGMDGTKAFCQEYPFNSAEAFQASGDDVFIAPNVAITAARMDAEKYGSLLIGVDPSRFGSDRTAIIRRQGRVLFGKQTFLKYDTMQIAGICHSIILKEKPAKMFIDIVGLGAGVYDRLKELGHEDIIVAVNSGTTPNNQDKYYNKRAEMWGDFRDWLLEYPCQIPDDPELLSDICSVKYKFDSRGRLVIEKKEEMKKRGVRSPDTADAACLTFYFPVSAYQLTRASDKQKAQNIMKSFKSAQRMRAVIANSNR